MNNKICLFCGKEFKPKNKNQKFCDSICKQRYYSNNNKCRTYTCDNCKKKFNTYQYKDKHSNIFCSHKCSAEWHSKQSREIRNCEICGKSFECKKSEKLRFCSQKCQGIWFKNTIGKDETYKKYRNKVILKELHDGKIKTTNTKPCRMICELLNKNNILFETEKRVSRFSMDIYLNTYNLYIEIMGDFWHCNPIKYTEAIYDSQKRSLIRDEHKREYADKHDIHILFLWEYDINNNIDMCEQLISKFICNNGILDNYDSFNYHLNNNKLLLNTDIMEELNPM